MLLSSYGPYRSPRRCGRSRNGWRWFVCWDSGWWCARWGRWNALPFGAQDSESETDVSTHGRSYDGCWCIPGSGGVQAEAAAGDRRNTMFLGSLGEIDTGSADVAADHAGSRVEINPYHFVEEDRQLIAVLRFELRKEKIEP